MRSNPVRRKLSQGQQVFGLMAFEFFTPGLSAVMAAAGAEFIIFDMEHSGAGIDVMKVQFAAARGAGIVPLVRVPGIAYHLIAPLLDAGAFGIMAPMLETVEQAQLLADACRYRPLGKRGLAFRVAHDDYATSDVPAAIAAANERTMVIALVESEVGIANIEGIMAVPGIDVGWLGHYDLTDFDGHPRPVRGPAIPRRGAKAGGCVRRQRQGGGHARQQHGFRSRPDGPRLSHDRHRHGCRPDAVRGAGAPRPARASGACGAMSVSALFARLVAWFGAAAILWRRLQGGAREQAVGSAPAIPAAKPQGSIPTLKMPTARGWAPGQTPVAAPGLKVNAFATGLKHPRWIHVLPNGDVTVAEALFTARPHHRPSSTTPWSAR